MLWKNLNVQSQQNHHVHGYIIEKTIMIYVLGMNQYMKVCLIMIFFFIHFYFYLYNRKIIRIYSSNYKCYCSLMHCVSLKFFMRKEFLFIIDISFFLIEHQKHYILQVYLFLIIRNKLMIIKINLFHCW